MNLPSTGHPGDPAGVPAGPPVSPDLPSSPNGAPPATPEVASRLFGERLALAEQYVALLADTGISHGLVGPRERPRLWDRHVLGCAVLADAIPPGSRVLDIGSGAGLPGLVLAIRRPDLHLELVEPLHRRCVWLESTVETLGLTNVVVHEGRADSRWGGARVDVVTARAVARIGVLAQWGLPLLVADGVMVALKGASAAVELTEDAEVLTKAGAQDWSVDHLGVGLIDPPATVVTVRVGDHLVTGRPAKAAGKRKAKPMRKNAPPRTTK